jgi:hypothetical protein
MKLFSLSLLSISFVLVGFGLLNMNEVKTQKKNIELKVNPVFECGKFQTNEYSQQLNNRLSDYMDRSVKQGVKASEDARGIKQNIRTGKLVLVTPQTGFELDAFHYSYPVLTPYAKKILTEIGQAFHDSLQFTPLANTRLLVTSMTRTHHSVSKLVRCNRTAVKKSPHLNGNTFDFSFSRFVSNESLSACEIQYLQELSASILLKFRQDCKLWATFERHEECLHVVTRMGK